MSATNECYIIENNDDFMIIMMGCGVGYFLMGYLISSCLLEMNKKDNNRQKYQELI